MLGSFVLGSCFFCFAVLVGCFAVTVGCFMAAVGCFTARLLQLLWVVSRGLFNSSLCIVLQPMRIVDYSFVGC